MLDQMWAIMYDFTPLVAIVSQEVQSPRSPRNSQRDPKVILQNAHAVLKMVYCFGKEKQTRFVLTQYLCIKGVN